MHQHNRSTITGCIQPGAILVLRPPIGMDGSAIQVQSQHLPSGASEGMALFRKMTANHTRSSNTQRKPTGGLSSRGNMLIPRDQASNQGVGGQAPGGRCCRS